MNLAMRYLLTASLASAYIFEPIQITESSILDGGTESFLSTPYLDPFSEGLKSGSFGNGLLDQRSRLEGASPSEASGAGEPGMQNPAAEKQSPARPEKPNPAAEGKSPLGISDLPDDSQKDLEPEIQGPETSKPDTPELGTITEPETPKSGTTGPEAGANKPAAAKSGVDDDDYASLAELKNKAHDAVKKATHDALTRRLQRGGVRGGKMEEGLKKKIHEYGDKILLDSVMRGTAEELGLAHDGYVVRGAPELGLTHEGHVMKRAPEPELANESQTLKASTHESRPVHQNKGVHAAPIQTNTQKPVNNQPRPSNQAAQFGSRLREDEPEGTTPSKHDIHGTEEQRRDRNELFYDSVAPETDFLEKTNDGIEQSDLATGSEMQDTEYLRDDDKKPKASTPYWTEVLVNKQMKKVLVNVKTVTIIESISPEKPATVSSNALNAVAVSSKASTSKSTAAKSISAANSKSVAGQSPFIKIQMPSSKSAKPTASQSTTSESKYGKKIAPSTENPSQKYGGKKAKKVAPSSASISSKPPVASVSSKPEAKSSIKSVQTSTLTAKQSAKGDKPTTFGDIFNATKNVPGAETAGSRDLYIEGKFTFPKEKILSKKVFKMNGYISND